MMKRHDKISALLRTGLVIPAIPLALHEDRSFDTDTQRLLTRYYLHAGSGGIAVGVHTTQFAIRLPQYALYQPVLETVSREIDAYEAQTERVVVKIAGVCGEMTQAVQEATLCKTLGFDAVLLSPSGLGHLSEAELLERTRAVCAVLPVIGFYLQPSAGGRVLSFNYWAQLAEIENVIAIKCASFNRYSTLEVMRAVAQSSRCDEIVMYTGNDDNIVVDLLTRYQFNVNGKTVTKCFEGGLLGHWSVWTHSAVTLLATLHAAKKTGVISPELLTLATHVTETNAAFFDAAHGFDGCIPGLHEVLRRQGLMKGLWCLNPQETLSPGQLEEIDHIYRAYPELNDDAFICQNIDTWKQGLSL